MFTSWGNTEKKQKDHLTFASNVINVVANREYRIVVYHYGA